MRFWRRFCAADAAVAAYLFCAICLTANSARADDEARILLFSGRDLWWNGAFAFGGFLIAPRSLDEDGFILKAMLSSGLYRYNAQSLGGEQVVGAEGIVQLSPGWRTKIGTAEFKFFMGPEFQIHRLWPDDPSNRLRGHFLGLRMSAELWYEPTSATMIAADLSLSSIATSNSGRLAFGFRVLDEMLGGVYAGPETQFFGSDGYRHLRFGAHVTSMKTEDMEWSAGLGWATDSSGRSSPYLRLGLIQRR
jgi:hypothetical protein